MEPVLQTHQKEFWLHRCCPEKVGLPTIAATFPTKNIPTRIPSAVVCFFLEPHNLQEPKLKPPKELNPLEMLEHQELVTVTYPS